MRGGNRRKQDIEEKVTLWRLLRAGGGGRGKVDGEKNPVYVTLWDTDSRNHFLLKHVQDHVKHK